MNPNLAAPYPEDPNLAPAPPTIEAVPEVNEPWENEQVDRQRLDGILQTARRIEMDEAASAERVRQLREAEAGLIQARRAGNDGQINFYQGIADQLVASIHQGMRDRSVRRDDNEAALDSLLADTNPTALLTTLRRESTAAQANTAGHNTAARKASDKARTASATGTAAEVRYHAATRHFANNPPADEDEKTRRARTMRELDSSTSADSIAARKANRAAEFAARTRDYNAGYPDAVDDLADHLERRFATEWNNAERLNRTVVHELRNWDPLAGPSDPNQADRVRQQLVQFQACIDRLPRHDTLRAEAQADYVRLRHRFESRMIHEGNLNGEPSQTAAFTENRGVLMYEGTAEEVILHEDGSTERPDPATGNWVRMTASGEPWTPPAPTELVIDPNAPVQPLDRAFAAWEENRTPETAAAAYASLTEHINRQGGVEAQHTANIRQYNTEIQSNDALEVQCNDAITDNTDAINALNPQLAANRSALGTINATLAAEGRGATKAEQKQIKTLNETIAQQEEEIRSRTDQNTNLANTITQAQADTVRLRGQITTENAARERVREGLNPARYWHGFLEINAERRVAEARASKLGRFLARREAERATDALPAAPMLLADGSLVFDTAVINSRRTPTDAERQAATSGDVLPSWQIWQDGTSARYDTRIRETVYYDARGRAFTHPVGVRGI